MHTLIWYHAALNLAWPRFSFYNDFPLQISQHNRRLLPVWFFLKAMSRVNRERALFVWTDCHAAVIPAVFNKGLFDTHSIMSDCTEVGFQSSYMCVCVWVSACTCQRLVGTNTETRLVTWDTAAPQAGSWAQVMKCSSRVMCSPALHQRLLPPL